MRNLWKHLAPTLICSLNLATCVFGQSVGDDVVLVVDKTNLMNGTTVVDTLSRGDYLHVRKVNGPWLLVDADGTRGWLNGDHVILASRAIDYFTGALRRNPMDDDALVARAIAWKDRGELANSIRDCTDAIAISPEWAWPYTIRGNAWHNKKDYDKAIADFTEAIRLNPKSAFNFDHRGDSYCGKEQYDKALADFTMVAELNPALGHNSLAWLMATCPCNEIRNGELAVEHAKKAVELEKNQLWRAYFLDTLAAAFAEAGDFAEAVAQQQRAVTLVPDDEKADLRKRLALYLAGKPYHQPKPGENPLSDTFDLPTIDDPERSGSPASVTIDEERTESVVLKLNSADADPAAASQSK